jgi:hypothetical protein
LPLGLDDLQKDWRSNGSKLPLRFRSPEREKGSCMVSVSVSKWEMGKKTIVDWTSGLIRARGRAHVLYQEDGCENAQPRLDSPLKCPAHGVNG